MSDPAFVYRCYDAEGSLLYVGCAGDVHKRLEGHTHTSFWIWDVASVKARYYPTRALARQAEREAIRELRPRYNIIGRDTRNRRDWTPQDYVDYLLASTRGGTFSGFGREGHIERLKAEYIRRFGLELPSLLRRSA